VRYDNEGSRGLRRGLVGLAGRGARGRLRRSLRKRLRHGRRARLALRAVSGPSFHQPTKTMGKQRNEIYENGRPEPKARVTPYSRFRWQGVRAGTHPTGGVPRGG
jgi:hypothetical protein